MLAGIGALVTTLGAGCGTTTVKTVTTTTTPTSGTSTGPAPETTPDQTATAPAKVGSSLTLAGFEGLKMKVTVTAYLDPATGGEFNTPAQGARFVGVKLELVNVSQTAYDSSPTNGAKLITDTDEQADATITTGGTCESPSSVTIAPGDKRNVCIPFEIPTAQKGKTFQFALNSGFADQKGQWSLEGAATSGVPAADPAAVISQHLEALNSGDYQAAFKLLTASYQARNPSWVSDRQAAAPRINIISVGTPQSGSGGAKVPVDFYARDLNATRGSDTKCREFKGTVHMVKESGGWRYDPSGSSLNSTVVASTNPNCPS